MDQESATEPPARSEPEELREEIRETREDLGKTVEALAGRADVKAQARQRFDDGKERLRRRQEQARAKLTEVGAKARNVTPEQARGAAGQVAHRAQKRPLPFALAGAFVAGLFAGRRLGRR
jgi:methyl-accepting chemotaxis protein